MEKETFFQKLTTLYLACMGSVLLLYPGVKGYLDITAQKSKLFLLLSGSYLAICVIGRLELALLGGKPIPGLRMLWRNLHLTQKLTLGLWAVTALSTVFSVDFKASLWGGSHWEGFLTLSLYYGCFLLVSMLAKPKPWLLGLFGGSLCVNSAVAWLQLAGYNPMGLYPLGTNYYDGGKLYMGRFLGTVGSVTLQAAVLSLAIPAFVLCLIKGRHRLRWLLLVPLLLCVRLLFVLQISAGIVGVLGGILLSLPVIGPKNRTRRRLLTAVGLTVAAGLAAVYLFGESLPGFLPELSGVLHGNWEDSYGSDRVLIWREVLELVPERPLLGGGPDTLGLRIDLLKPVRQSRVDVTVFQVLDMAHNEYLNILVNQGIPALLLYLSILAAAAVEWIRLAPKDPTAAVCGGLVLGYCLQAFFGLSTPFTTSYLWLGLALLVVRARGDRRKRASKELL